LLLIRRVGGVLAIALNIGVAVYWSVSAYHELARQGSVSWVPLCFAGLAVLSVTALSLRVRRPIRLLVGGGNLVTASWWALFALGIPGAAIFYGTLAVVGLVTAAVLVLDMR
jgi:hypothetical protein